MIIEYKDKDNDEYFYEMDKPTVLHIESQNKDEDNILKKIYDDIIKKLK